MRCSESQTTNDRTDMTDMTGGKKQTRSTQFSCLNETIRQNQRKCAEIPELHVYLQLEWCNVYRNE